MFPVNRPSATFTTTLPADQTTLNAVDTSIGEPDVFGPTTPWEWGNAADDPTITGSLNPTTQQSARPRRMSDSASHSELLRTRAYAELLHLLGAEYQLTILTGRGLATSGRSWVFIRSDRDFTRDERDLAARLQPILIALDVAGGMAAPLTAARDEADRVRLTDRELEVLRLVDQGLTANAIGHALRISEKTVRKHLQNVYQKLGTHDRLLAVARGRQLGLFATANRPSVECSIPS
ncbi:MAG: LuxR C-terminal-related transcriptional regulator [Terracoccus sp.]